MNAERDGLVREIANMLGLLLVEVQLASQEMHSGRVPVEADFMSRWDEAVVKAVATWKRHFDADDWRLVDEPVAQLSRRMDYYPTTDLANSKKIDELVSALTLKAYDLCDMR